MSHQLTAGLLLAAGRGRRMSGKKQFHLVETSDGQKPLVVAAFDTIARVCDSMFVVLGHRSDEVADLLAPSTFELVIADPDAPMVNSIKVGLQTILSRRDRPCGKVPAILLQLGDHPALEEDTLERLLRFAAENPDKAIMPTYQGRGGHPVVIPHSIAEQILATPCPDGLRQYWLENPELSIRIEVDDRGVIHNLNAI